MIPEGVKYYGGGGVAKYPCEGCPKHKVLPGYDCTSWRVCEFYGRWIKASWEKFNRYYVREMKKAGCDNCLHGDLSANQSPCSECTRKHDEPPTEWTPQRED